MQRFEIDGIELPQHIEAMPGDGTLRLAFFPAPEIARVMAEGAIDAQRFRHVDHERKALLRLLDRCARDRRQRRLALDAKIVVAEKMRREWIDRQCGVAIRL